MSQEPSWVANYLDLLQLPREQPTLSYLGKICRRHLAIFPFENVGKLLDYSEGSHRSRLVPTVEEFLERRRQYQLGGTCYILNYHLFQLLRAVGFDCDLLLLGEDHLAILVRLPEGERVYVDVGSAAPLFQPVRFEKETENSTGFGGHEVRLRSVGEKTRQWQYTSYFDGQLGDPIWTFQLDNTASSIEAFADVIDRSYQTDGAFMNLLRCQVWQWEQKRSLSLVNNRFRIRYQDGTVEKRTLTDGEAIHRVLVEEFGYPDFPTKQVMGILEARGVDLFQEKGAS
ncbi:arylamine N-acetyltransferase [Desmospora activa]|uniref:Arylamine N-acetyltransferase n=1 Tax=Desmospora activa DSM 45169 TaxID=1121389 RepID=A0A2T4Z750_9BACL|nr:arylamine N-acetyltransferase [Desmospora activa]PTM57706.1 arylamine N-acetyltransferase [Desmospora activa DSM 45169]